MYADVRIPNLRRLEKYITDYEQQTTPQGKIVFYGDSAFTRWSTKWGMIPLEEALRMKDGSQAAVNRGFGTSTAEEQLYYYPRMILPLKPRALVVQTLGNDRDLNYSPAEILYLQARLFDYARHDMPGIRLYVCDTRPLMLDCTRKNTWYYHELEYNERLAEYCRRHDDVTLVRHAASPIFFEEGHVGDYTHPRTDIFVEDQVHYNQTGYHLYADFFRGVLDDLL